MAIVVDTSCLITLSKIGKVELLNEVFPELVVPGAVEEEFGYELPKFLRVVAVKDKDFLEFGTSSLGPGESEVLTLAVELNADGVIIDEKKGRREAKKLGLKVLGTLGLLLLAKKGGLIDDLENMVNKIVENGFYISDSKIKEVLDIDKKKTD
jgi:predicted nucleic acid-binding protein